MSGETQCAFNGPLPLGQNDVGDTAKCFTEVIFQILLRFRRLTAIILDGVLGRVDDPSLRVALQVEVDRMRSIKDFGLVFEKRMSENVRLYSHPVRRGLRIEELAS